MDGRTVTTDDLLAQGRWVRALARSLVADPNAADDVEQQAWLEAIERPPRHGRNLRAWFARLVRRRALDQRRGEDRRRRRESAALRRGGGPPADDVLLRAETRARIAKEVLALEEPYRSAVLLRWFEEMTPADVAVHLGVPVATVRTRLARGLVQLRERLLRGDGHDEPKRLAALVALAQIPGPAAAATAAAGAAGGLVVATQGKLAVAAVALLLIGGGGYVAFRALDAPAAEEVEGAAPAESYGTNAPAALEGAPAAAAPDRAVAARPGGAPVESPDVRRGEPVGAGVVAGAVHDEHGGAIEKTDVLLWDEIGRVIQMRGTTAADGTFRFETVAEGAHKISFHAAGRGTALAQVEAGGGSLDVTLRPAPTGPPGQAGPTAPSGTAIAGVVVDEAERPVAGVRIEATPEGPKRPGALVFTTEDGAFELGGLAAGEWRVLVGTFQGWAEGPAAEFLPQRVGPVTPGGERLHVVLQRGREISGEVHAPGGERWTDGAAVHAYPVSDAGGVDFGGVRMAKTAADGTFRIPGLPAGAYAVRVEASPEGRPVGGFAYLPRVTAGTVGLVVRLERGKPLAGRLVDEDGAPVLGTGWVWVAEVGAEPGGPGSVAAKVFGDGRFETTPLDEGKSYRLRASGFEGHGYAEAKGLRPGDPDVVVRLPRAGTLTGQVLDGEGKPVGARVPVHLHRDPSSQAAPTEAPTAVVFTDAEGRFRAGGLSKGTWYLEAGGGATGWIPTAGGSAVDPSGQSIPLVVGPGAPLSGRLVDARGEPLAFVDLLARAADASSLVTAAARTDADGRFSFRGVPGRAVELSAKIADRPTPLGRQEVPAEDVTVRAP